MAKINLRPWREELRAEKQRDFVGLLAMTFIVAAGLAFAWLTKVESDVAYQNDRNAYIESATKDLDKKIKEIQELKKKREQLIARMKVIQNLQGKRPVIVRVFDELVRTLPDGLYYVNVSSKSNKLSIDGKAESNNRISALMRNLDQSAWFGEPNLSSVAADKKDQTMNAFQLSVTQETPKAEKEGAKK
jgi:type IV pilus assembly protein PilN